MRDVARRWTREEVLALPDDGNRYELIDGELLVSPSPRPVHQIAVLALYNRLRPYVEQHQLGQILLAPADLDFDRGYVAQPDLFVVPWHERRRAREWSEYGIPIFIAEVLSPTTGRNDRVIKRPAYQRAGVGDYWIVDPDSRVVERWQPADLRPEVALARISWRPGAAVPAFELDLAEYFDEV
jgi:Uma2 family endonuclease